MPADVILEMRVNVGSEPVRASREKVAKLRQRSLKFGWFEIDSFLSLISPRGTPKSHLRIGESGRKRTLSIRGIGPAKRWYCYGGFNIFTCRQMWPRFLSLFRPDRWFCITIISGKCRKCEPPTFFKAWRSKSILLLLAYVH